MEYFQWIVSRPDFHRPFSTTMPLHLRSIGRYRMAEDYVSDLPPADFLQFFWCVEGEGTLKLGGKSYHLPQGSVAWKPAGVTHGYHPAPSVWEVCWLTFDGPFAQSFMESYGYPLVMHQAGPCPLDLFEEIETGLKIATVYELRRLVGVTAAILALAGCGLEGQPPADSVLKRFQERARQGFPDPDLNVERLAAELGIHRTTLLRHIRAATGETPAAFLRRLRIQHAITLLEEGELTVAQVAEEVGMPDPSHFARTFRRIAGRPPKEYRG